MRTVLIGFSLVVVGGPCLQEWEWPSVSGPFYVSDLCTIESRM